jgi:hypothetical protein
MCGCLKKDLRVPSNLCCSFFNSRLDIHIARLVGRGL